MSIKRTISFGLGPLFLALLTACGQDGPAAPGQTQQEATPLTVYKNPTCGCCEAWMAHMADAGFAPDGRHQEALARVKDRLGVAPALRSCHTAVSEDGHVFEGHVPAALVRRFLNDPPAGAVGLAVPNMPVGSPGMEMGDRFQPYEVRLIGADGSSEVYARVDAPGRHRLVEAQR